MYTAEGLSYNTTSRGFQKVLLLLYQKTTGPEFKKICNILKNILLTNKCCAYLKILQSEATKA